MSNPDGGKAISVKNGRYGPYVTEDADDGEKPRTASLFKSMSPDTVTLEEALRLLSLPRVLGVDPEDGEEVIASNGRYGPFIRKGASTRSLELEEQLLTIRLEEALERLAQPKPRGRRAAAAATPLEGARPRPGERQADGRSRTAASDHT